MSLFFQAAAVQANISSLIDSQWGWIGEVSCEASTLETSKLGVTGNQKFLHWEGRETSVLTQLIFPFPKSRRVELHRLIERMGNQPVGGFGGNRNDAAPLTSERFGVDNLADHRSLVGRKSLAWKRLKSRTEVESR